jgi:hypothetical protein
LKSNTSSVTCYRTKTQSKSDPPVTDSPIIPRDARVKVTLVARPLVTPAAQVRARWIHEQNVFILESHFASRSVATRVLTGQYRTRQQYVAWLQHFGSHTMFACDTCSSSDGKQLELRQILKTVSAATMGELQECCHWFRFCA